jgi:hypothetical protein
LLQVMNLSPLFQLLLVRLALHSPRGKPAAFCYRETSCSQTCLSATTVGSLINNLIHKRLRVLQETIERVWDSRACSTLKVTEAQSWGWGSRFWPCPASTVSLWGDQSPHYVLPAGDEMLKKVRGAQAVTLLSRLMPS